MNAWITIVYQLRIQSKDLHLLILVKQDVIDIVELDHLRIIVPARTADTIRIHLLKCYRLLGGYLLAALLPA